jgi:hypothetical protein
MLRAVRSLGTAVKAEPRLGQQDDAALLARRRAAALQSAFGARTIWRVARRRVGRSAMFHRRQYAALLAPIVLLSGAASSAQVVVEGDTFRNAISYTLARGDCRIKWNVERFEGRIGIASYSVCGKSLAEQREMLEEVLTAVLVQGTPSTLGWGRLTPDQPQDDLAMAFRLALAAHRSREWDGVRGRPRAGDINGFAVRLANDREIYPELKELFRKSGLRLRLSACEKVLVGPAAKLPFYDRLEAAGVKSSEKLPFDFQPYFSVSALSAPPR